ncbi:MAG: aminopeptidase P family protein [bacterium]|nr:aminopeptidase P family protein [bacterium]
MQVLEQLTMLRKVMKDHAVDYYLVPTDDFHGSEYVGDYFKARAFLSGFTGSAGTLLVGMQGAWLWTDGRYFLQAAAQLSGSGIELMKSGEPGVPKLSDFLSNCVKDRQKIGFDGRTVSLSFVRMLREKLGDKKVMIDGSCDLVDLIWKNRPALSNQKIWELLECYTGLSREEKIALMRQQLEQKNCDVLLLTALDEIAWVLNLRGGDVDYTPVFLSYLLIGKEEVILFAREGALSDELTEKLGQAGVSCKDYFAIEESLRQLSDDKCIWVDESVVNARLFECIPDICKLHLKKSPVALMKACKTAEEMEHTRLAHRKDAVAMIKFIYWLKHHVAIEHVTEISAAENLLELRKQMEGFVDQSFAPIIAYGPHGAIVHYSATTDSNVRLQPKGLCLMDTGAHYLDGTTDITRTVALGELTEEEKRAFTIVLKGNLRLGAAVFQKGMCGRNLDLLARGPLWDNGLDYNHGTGHGVGYLLCVHEGPQRVHWRKTDETETPLEEGMILSNEPGLYLEGKFGIRHENLIVVKELQKNEYGQLMHFETMTMVPFDLDAIDSSLLTSEEKKLLNEYHKKVYETVSQYLTKEECIWLQEMTREI